MTLTNKGGTTVSYDVASAVAWLSVAPAAGSLQPGASRSVTISAERAGLPEGASEGTLTVSWDEGTVPVAVTASRETPPVIGAVSVVRSACGQNGRTVYVSAPIEDEAGIASASVAWSGLGTPGSGTLRASGGVWAGPVGPFAVGGTAQLVLTATDNRGNTAQRGAAISVEPCPQ